MQMHIRSAQRIYGIRMTFLRSAHIQSCRMGEMHVNENRSRMNSGITESWHLFF